MDAAALVHVRRGALLHDIGKVGIPDRILQKPGPLTDVEFTHVRNHVHIGLEILSPLRHLGEALDFIRDHHERWGGGGYPRGISAELITLGGRILTAADAFDALTNRRAYRGPLSTADTLDYLRTQVGGLLEPRVFDALAAVIERGFDVGNGSSD